MSGWLSRDGVGTGRPLSHLLWSFSFSFSVSSVQPCVVLPSIRIRRGSTTMPQRLHQNMSKSHLIKGHGRLYVEYGKHSRDSSVAFLVKGIDILCHSAPFAKTETSSALSRRSVEDMCKTGSLRFSDPTRLTSSTD